MVSIDSIKRKNEVAAVPFDEEKYQLRYGVRKGFSGKTGD
jgi:hypothetical protein